MCRKPLTALCQPVLKFRRPLGVLPPGHDGARSLRFHFVDEAHYYEVLKRSMLELSIYTFWSFRKLKRCLQLNGEVVKAPETP